MGQSIEPCEDRFLQPWKIKIQVEADLKLRKKDMQKLTTEVKMRSEKDWGWQWQTNSIALKDKEISSNKRVLTEILEDGIKSIQMAISREFPA